MELFTKHVDFFNFVSKLDLFALHYPFDTCIVNDWAGIKGGAPILFVSLLAGIKFTAFSSIESFLQLTILFEIKFMVTSVLMFRLAKAFDE